MRVPQLLAALSYGDAIGNEALAIQRQLRAAGHESDVFAELVHPRMAHLARPLREYHEVSSPETVCLYHFSIGSAAGRLIHAAPDRLVVVYHNITPARFFLGFHAHLAGLCHHGRRELSAFAPRAELGLGDSEYNRRELEEAGFRRTGVLPIVLDLSLCDREPSPVVRERFDDGWTNVLFVGRVIPNKRIDDIIRSFAVFQRWLRPRSRLLLVGDHRGFERYLLRLRELVADLGVEQVVFTGHVDDDELYAFYRVSDAFLCLSEHEGFCVPLQEAMHFNLPVVAYDAGAVRETLRGGGILLQDKRPELVAELLDQVTRGGPLRRAVLESQARAIASIRSTDFGALLAERLDVVPRSAGGTRAESIPRSAGGMRSEGYLGPSSRGAPSASGDEGSAEKADPLATGPREGPGTGSAGRLGESPGERPGERPGEGLGTGPPPGLPGGRDNEPSTGQILRNPARRGFRRGIHQWVPALHRGDAIGDSALLMRDAFRRWGHEADVWAPDVDEELAGEGRSYAEFASAGAGPDDVVILHYAVPSRLTDDLRAFPGRRVLLHHNITPPEFFAAWDPEMVHICALGREQVAGLRDHVHLALADSEFSRRELEALGFARTGVLPIHLDFARYREPPGPVLLRQLDDERTNLLFVGRVAPNKRHEDLVRLASYWKRFLSPAVRLVLVGRLPRRSTGDGRPLKAHYLDALRAFAYEEGLTPEEVVFTGHLDHRDLLAAYAGADIFVSTSEHEGFGVPLVEAMLMRVPVLARRAAAVGFTLGAGGVTFDGRDLAAVAEMGHRLATDALLREKVLLAQDRRLEAFAPAAVEATLRRFVDSL